MSSEELKQQIQHKNPATAWCDVTGTKKILKFKHLHNLIIIIRIIVNF